MTTTLHTTVPVVLVADDGAHISSAQVYQHGCGPKTMRVGEAIPSANSEQGYCIGRVVACAGLKHVVHVMDTEEPVMEGDPLKHPVRALSRLYDTRGNSQRMVSGLRTRSFVRATLDLTT
jgi:hypothetical protein